MSDGLTAKQRKFVEEYLVDLNATQAAIRAGYSQKTAKSIGQENLTKPDIQAEVQKAMQKASERTEITQDYILTGLKGVAERCLQEIKPLLNMRGQQVKDDEGNLLFVFNASGANRAFELLGKHLGMFTDKTELTGPNGGPIETKHSGTVTLTADLKSKSLDELTRLFTEKMKG